MEHLVAERADQIASWGATLVFLMFAVLETARPARTGPASAVSRWVENFCLYAACLGVLYWLAPGALAARIVAAPANGSVFGAVHRLGGDGLVLATGLLTIDFLFYLLHVVEHRVFVLWRFHAVHHSDRHVDVTTGLRHHPAEVFVNALLASAVLISLGQPVWVAAAYGLVSTMAALFNHSNIGLPAAWERVIGLAVVTPGLHRVHHSAEPEHYNSNFGNVLSIWDRLCGTYRRLPPDQEASLAFGIPPSEAASRFGPLREWVLPFTLRRQRSGGA